MDEEQPVTVMNMSSKFMLLSFWHCLLVLNLLYEPTTLETMWEQLFKCVREFYVCQENSSFLIFFFWSNFNVFNSRLTGARKLSTVYIKCFPSSLPSFPPFLPLPFFHSLCFSKEKYLSNEKLQGVWLRVNEWDGKMISSEGLTIVLFFPKFLC